MCSDRDLFLLPNPLSVKNNEPEKFQYFRFVDRVTRGENKQTWTTKNKQTWIKTNTNKQEPIILMLILILIQLHVQMFSENIYQCYIPQDLGDREISDTKQTNGVSNLEFMEVVLQLFHNQLKAKHLSNFFCYFCLFLLFMFVCFFFLLEISHRLTELLPSKNPALEDLISILGQYRAQ